MNVVEEVKDEQQAGEVEIPSDVAVKEEEINDSLARDFIPQGPCCCRSQGRSPWKRRRRDSDDLNKLRRAVLACVIKASSPPPQLTGDECFYMSVAQSISSYSLRTRIYLMQKTLALLAEGEQMERKDRREE